MLDTVYCKRPHLSLQTFDGERCLYAALNDDVRHTFLDEGFKRAGTQNLQQRRVTLLLKQAQKIDQQSCPLQVHVAMTCF